MRFLLILSAFSLFTIGALGQEKPIADWEYQAALSKANVVAESVPSRSIKIEEYFRDVRKTGFERHVSERMSADRSRYSYHEEFDGKIEKLESIKVDGVTYCKEGNQEWEKGSCNRFTGIPSSSVLSRDFTREEIKVGNNVVIRFKQVLRYSVQDGKNRDVTREMYTHTKFEVDESGRLISMESSRGYPNSTEWKAVSKTTYEYRPHGLKIEAPIK